MILVIPSGHFDMSLGEAVGSKRHQIYVELDGELLGNRSLTIIPIYVDNYCLNNLQELLRAV